MVFNFTSALTLSRKVLRVAKFRVLKDNYDMTNVISVINDSVKSAVEFLAKGDVIAIPTDTVYGFAVDSRNCEAIQSLYNIKGRNFNKPIAICVGNVHDIATWGDVSGLPAGLLENLLPGPVTVILRRTDAFSLKLNPGVNKVGIRVPNSSFVRDIALKFKFAIALTSANVSNSSSTLNPEEFRELWPKLGAIFDGGTITTSDLSRAGSTIVDLSYSGKYKIVRDGCALKNTVSILEKFSLCQS